MFSWIVSDKPDPKCQSPTVLHSAANSGKINSLKDRIIIKQRFDGGRLMVWPLKCLESQSLSLYLSPLKKVSSRSRVTPQRGPKKELVRISCPKASRGADRWAQTPAINLCLRRYHPPLTAFVFPISGRVCGFVLYILEMFTQ